MLIEQISNRVLPPSFAESFLQRDSLLCAQHANAKIVLWKVWPGASRLTHQAASREALS